MVTGGIHISWRLNFKMGLRGQRPDARAAIPWRPVLVPKRRMDVCKIILITIVNRAGGIVLCSIQLIRALFPIDNLQDLASFGG